MKSKRVLLIAPPVTRPLDMLSDKVRIGIVPPLGLAYIAAVLEKEGIEVKILDCLVEGQQVGLSYEDMMRYGLTDEQIRWHIEIFNPQLVGVSCLTSNMAWDAHNVCRIVKEYNTNVITVMGGTHPTVRPDETLRDKNITAIITGEGEHSILRFIDIVNMGWDVGRIFSSYPLGNLDNLPFPARHLLPMAKYMNTDSPHSGVKRKPFTSMITSRGCPARCLPASESVLMTDGSTKSIGQIGIGEYVVSTDGDGGLVSSCVVATRQTPARSDIIKITTKDSGILRCTADHRVLSANGWVEAGTLRVGEYLVTQGKQTINSSRPSVGKGKRDNQGTIAYPQSNVQSCNDREESPIPTSQRRSTGMCAATDVKQQSDGESSYQGQSEPIYENIIQSNGRPRTESAPGRWDFASYSNDHETKGNSQRADEEKQSDEAARFKRPSVSCEKVASLFQSKKLCGKVLPEKDRAESNRSGIRTIIDSDRVPLCRRRKILDRPMPERKMPEPRFHLEEWQKQDSTTLQLDILAQSAKLRRQRGITGLHGQRLASLCDYRIHVEGCLQYINPNFPMAEFSEIESIIQEPTATVYDIETSPYHNFIASGFVVHNCAFCTIREMWGEKCRQRSPENVLTEIEQLVKTYGIKELHFEDDNLTFNKKRAMAIFQGIIDHKWDLSLNSPSGLALFALDEELLEKMAEAGYYSISLPIESGDPYVLKNLMHKNVDLEKAKRLVRKGRELGMKVKGFFILGYPGETKDSMKRTVDFAGSIGLDWAIFFIATPLPGTEMEAVCRKNNWLVNPDLDYMHSFYTPNIRTPEFDPDYVLQLKEQANAQINFKNNYNLKVGNYDRARADFQEVANMYPDLKIAQDALAEAKCKQQKG